MRDYGIRRLTNDFYDYYNNKDYPELLTKKNRSYDVAVFEIESLHGVNVAVPFRTEMKHRNGYHFRFSSRSVIHNSGLDYSKMVIISHDRLNLIGEASVVDLDEYIEFKKNKAKIYKGIENYINDYIDYANGSHCFILKKLKEDTNIRRSDIFIRN